MPVSGTGFAVTDFGPDDVRTINDGVPVRTYSRRH
jgi:hypothetical protein